MALIKCNECGKEMSDHAKQCPHCGCDNNIMFCPECDKQLSSKASLCPNCGCPIKKNKNIENEEINGFFIQIDFLDENGNTLTSISNNSQDVIDAKGELIMRNTISGLESDINIKSAKISYFEKNTVQENIENSMTEIEDSVEE